MAKRTHKLVDLRRHEFTPEQIAYVVGVGNYSRFHLVDGRQVLIAYTLKAMAGRFPNLVRIHKGHLINVPFFGDFTPERQVKMLDGTVLPVGRRRFTAVRDQINQILSINEQL